jgi:hypothetical protein
MKMENIQELIEALNNQSSLSEWILVVVTAVYVVMTGLICFFNHKSAKAATRQIEEMKKIQEQNASIQLFEKRYDIYYHLENFLGIVRKSLSNEMKDPETGEQLNAISAFDLLTFGNSCKRVGCQDCSEQFDFYHNAACRIEISAYLYSDIDCDKITTFTKSFMDLVSRMSEENFISLKNSFNELENSNVLQCMAEQLKVLEMR